MGCFVQLVQVSIQYFKYETVSQVLQMPKRMFVPSNINFCPRFTDILDWERITNETGMTMRRDYDDMSHNLLTIDQIFKYTPSNESAIQSCKLRGRDGTLFSFSGAECMQKFTVTKFFMQEYICYLIMMRNRNAIRMHDMTTSLTGQYVVSVANLSDQFKNAEYGLVVLSRNTVPTISRHFSATIRIRNVTRGKTESNRIYMRARSQSATLLPKPYDTGCMDVPYKLPIACKKNCLIQKYAKIDRVPAEEILLKPYPHRPLSEQDLDNVTARNYVAAAKKECQQKCHVIPCKTSYGFTTVMQSSDDMITFRASELTPCEPDTESFSQPKMEFIEYFSFMGGCMGLWFGFSVHQIDPVVWIIAIRKQWMRQRKKRTNAKNTGAGQESSSFHSSQRRASKFVSHAPPLSQDHAKSFWYSRNHPAPWTMSRSFASHGHRIKYDWNFG
jgi:hypothetical protein